MVEIAAALVILYIVIKNFELILTILLLPITVPLGIFLWLDIVAMPVIGEAIEDTWKVAARIVGRVMPMWLFMSLASCATLAAFGQLKNTALIIAAMLAVVAPFALMWALGRFTLWLVYRITQRRRSLNA